MNTANISQYQPQPSATPVTAKLQQEIDVAVDQLGAKSPTPPPTPQRGPVAPQPPRQPAVAKPVLASEQSTPSNLSAQQLNQIQEPPTIVKASTTSSTMSLKNVIIMILIGCALFVIGIGLGLVIKAIFLG